MNSCRWKSPRMIKLALAALLLALLAGACPADAARPPLHLAAADSFVPFTFALVADPHLGRAASIERFARAVEALNADPARPELVLVLGDIIWPPSRPLAEMRALLDRLEPAWFLAWGNNDFRRLGDYQREFGPLYYSFEHRNCLFIVLWNGWPAGGPRQTNHEGDIDEIQFRWLEATLAGTRSREEPYTHIFLFAHIPPPPDIDGGGNMYLRPAPSRRLAELCGRYRVSGAFFGHLHREESFQHEGTLYLTTADLQRSAGRTPGPGYRLVDVTAGRLDHQYVELEQEE